MYDGSKLATVGWTSAGVAMRTRPAPDRSAPAPQRAAAPAIPRDPAMTSTCPNRPLWLSRGLGPRTGTASIASSVMFLSLPAVALTRGGLLVRSPWVRAGESRFDQGDGGWADWRAWPMRRAIRLATCPPLKPASIFTTTTFEAQLLSMPRSAATPWKCAP